MFTFFSLYIPQPKYIHIDLGRFCIYCYFPPKYLSQYKLANPLTSWCWSQSNFLASEICYCIILFSITVTKYLRLVHYKEKRSLEFQVWRFWCMAVALTRLWQNLRGDGSSLHHGREPSPDDRTRQDSSVGRGQSRTWLVLLPRPGPQWSHDLVLGTTLSERHKTSSDQHNGEQASNTGTLVRQPQSYSESTYHAPSVISQIRTSSHSCSFPLNKSFMSVLNRALFVVWLFYTL